MDIANFTNYAVFFLSFASIYAIFVLALNIQWGLTGLFNLGVHGFFAVGAYASAIITAAPKSTFIGGFDLPVVAGIIAAILLSALVALLIGWATIRLRADYLAIATIGIAEIIRLVIKNEDWLTNGVRGIPAIPKLFTDIPAIGMSRSVVFLLFMLACVGIAYHLVERARVSPWGRVLRAVRENEDGTIAAGKNVNRFRLQAFVVGSAIMGFAGAMYAHFIGFISPEAFDPMYGTFIIWVMLIAGGSGNNWGVLIGTFIIWLVWSGSQILTDYLPSFLAHQSGAVRVLLIGVLLQVILLTRPQGLLPERQPRLPKRRNKPST